MAPTVTLVASGSWTDFSIQTLQAVTPSSTIPAGDRVFFVQGTTVGAGSGVSPGASGWGGLVSLYDTAGNVFTRDSPTGGVANNGTTAEVWSAYVKYPIPTSGYAVVATPDSRGMSAWWKVFGVNGLAENLGTSPVDKVAQADNVSVTSYTSGTTATLSTGDTWCLGVHSINTNPTAPWFTDTAGFSKIGSDQSGTGPGSGRALSVLQKEVTSTTGLASTGTATSASGASVIATYKVATPVAPDTSGLQIVQQNVQQTAAANSLAVTFPGSTTTGNLMVVNVTAWKSGGGAPGIGITDNKGNNAGFTAVHGTAPSTGGGARVYQWYCKNFTGGASHTVTATTSPLASSEISVSISEWSGGDTSAPLDQKNQATGSSATAQPGSVTVASNGEIYITNSTEDAGSLFINQSGWVKLADIAINQDIHVQWQKANAQTVNPSSKFVSGSTSWGAVIGTYKPAPAGGTSNPQTLTATSTTTMTMTRQMGKPVLATATTLASIARQIGKRLTATASSTATQLAQKAKLQTLTATSTTTASVARQTLKIVAATSTTTASIVRAITHTMAATVTTVALAGRTFTKTLTATATTAATIVTTFIAAGAQTIFTRFFKPPTPSSGEFKPPNPRRG